MSTPDIESLLDGLHQQLTQIVARCNELNDPSGRWGDIEAYMTRRYEVREVHVDFQAVLALIQRLRALARSQEGLVRPQNGDEVEEEEIGEEDDDEELELEQCGSSNESDKVQESTEAASAEAGDEDAEDSERLVNHASPTTDLDLHATATTAQNESQESSVDSNATLTVEDLISHLSDVAYELEPVVRRSWEFVVDERLTYADLRTGLRRMARSLRAAAAELAGMFARMEASDNDDDNSGDVGDDEGDGDEDDGEEDKGEEAEGAEDRGQRDDGEEDEEDGSEEDARGVDFILLMSTPPPSSTSLLPIQHLLTRHSPNSHATTSQSLLSHICMFIARPAGAKGIGLFATQLIPAGTRLLAEKPLFTVASESEAYAASRRLGSHDRKTFLGLVGGNARERSKRLWVEAGWHTVKEAVGDVLNIVRKRNGAKTWPRAASYLTARSTFLSNNFALSTSPSMRAIFPNISRLNHACVPNAEANWNANLDHFTVHTLSHVPEGEELTLSYLESHGAVAADRQEALSGFMFECGCAACAMRTPSSRQGETNRADLQIKVRDFAQSDGSKGELSIMRAMLELYEQEGIRGRELATMYVATAEMARSAGAVENARALAKRGLELEETCCGRDSPFFAKSLADVERLQLGDLDGDKASVFDTTESSNLAAAAS